MGMYSAYRNRHEYSQLCLSCPLAECVEITGYNLELCPIEQAQQDDRRNSRTTFLDLAELEDRTGIKPFRIHTWLHRGKLKKEEFKRGDRNKLLIPAELVPKLERLAR